MKKSVNLNTGVAGNVVRDTLRYNYDAEALPRLVADWNMNRYTTPTVSNIIDETEYGFDVEAFPISSVTEVSRPGRKGIAKAIVNQSIVSSGYANPADPKFYVGAKEDIYKYWVSPKPTGSTGLFPTITVATANGKTPVTSAETCVQPTVVYNKTIKVNKIVVRTENTWATVNNWNIQVATNAGATNWTNVGPANPVVDANGIAAIYFNNDGWGATAGVLTAVLITGIRLVVKGMGPGKRLDGTTTSYRNKWNFNVSSKAYVQPYVNTDGKNSNFSLIAIEPHYEVDFTDRLISTTDTFDMGESSQLYPIGTITSNQATVTLDNTDTLLDQDNTTSPYYGLLDANVEFNLQYIYDVNNVKHSVQGFRMYSGVWGPGESTVQISLEDSSKFLKEVRPNSTMYENKTVTEIVWRILDSVGFHDYEIGVEDIDPKQFVIPIFWTTGEEVVWEVLDELAKSSQTAIYFDSRNKLQVRTREAAFRKAAVVDWNIYGQKEGINLPDLISLEQTDEMESNKIVVSYKDTNWRTNVYGNPALSRVWDTDSESLVLRSSALANTLGLNDTTISLTSTEASVWPYASTINIDAEILSYDAKEYTYYVIPDPSNPNVKTPYTVWLTSEDDKKTYDKKTNSDYRWMNTYTGLLRVKERGLWNSTKSEHTINNADYTGFYDPVPGATIVGGHVQDATQSVININVLNTSIYKVQKAGPRTTYNRFGTKVKLNSDGSVNQIAGINAYSSKDNMSGYHFEIMSSDKVSPEQFANGVREVQLFRRDAAGNYFSVFGSAQPILEDYWYELDMDITRGSDANGPFDFIRCFVNGKLVIQTGFYSPLSPTNTFGMYTRYNTNASFEYMYAVDRDINGPGLQDFSFYDLKAGGFRGALFEREFVYDTLTSKKRVKVSSTAEQDKYGRMIFSDFGPYVHEIREFDVKFDPAPVLNSFILSTNTFYTALLEYQATPYGAHFVVANTAREHAILAGEDNLIYSGSGATVSQVFTVLGRDLEIAEAQKVESKNEQQIRTRGVIETEFSSDWIQSKAMAQELADWINLHWSKGVDQLEAEVFGNPLLEVGDVLDVSYNEKHMTPTTHKYFVVGTSTQFDQGLSTTLTLRRVRV